MQAAAKGPCIPVLTDVPMCAVISIECMPEACVLVKGKPRVRMVPEQAADKDEEEAQVQRAAAKEEAIGSGTADPAADMFKSKASPFHDHLILTWASRGCAWRWRSPLKQAGE